MILNLLALLLDKTKDIPSVPSGNLTADTITNILHVIFGFAGGVALLIIVRSAFRYSVSQGEPQAIKKQKDSILYAVAGLIVSIVSFYLVPFVIEKVK